MKTQNAPINAKRTLIHPIVDQYLPEPNSIYLYYVDRCDNLDRNPNLQQDIISTNSIDCLFDHILYTSYHDPAYELYAEIAKKMANDGHHTLAEEYEEEIIAYLNNHDQSDPAKELLDNTDNPAIFYTLDARIAPQDPYDTDPESRIAEIAHEIARTLKLTSSDSINKLSLMLLGAYDGGDLRIYFQAPIPSLLSPSKDFQSITFNGSFCVAVHNPSIGSGDYIKLDLNLTLPFNRSNLIVSKAETYSIEETCGLVTDWTTTTSPSFSYNPADLNTTLFDDDTEHTPPYQHLTFGEASAATELAKQRAYTATYEQGGCTFGDNNIKRHRNVTYINDYPCGDKCPHCGQFWVD